MRKSTSKQLIVTDLWEQCFIDVSASEISWARAALKTNNRG